MRYWLNGPTGACVECSCFVKYPPTFGFSVSLCSSGSGTVYDGLLAYLDGVLCVSDVFPVSTVAHFGGRSIVKLAVL